MHRAVLVGAALGWAGESFAARRAGAGETLWSKSELVVVGEITGRECAFAADGSGRIETWWDVAVVEAVREPPRERIGDSLRLVTPGGELAGLGLDISDAPELAVDQRYLLMLTRRADGDGWRLVGGPEGALALDPAAPEVQNAP